MREYKDAVPGSFRFTCKVPQQITRTHHREKKTKGQWSEIVEPKDDLERIADMIREISRDLPVTVNVNNHYEGSAPKTINRLSLLLR